MKNEIVTWMIEKDQISLDLESIHSSYMYMAWILKKRKKQALYKSDVMMFLMKDKLTTRHLGLRFQPKNKKTSEVLTNVQVLFFLKLKLC